MTYRKELWTKVRSMSPGQSLEIDASDDPLRALHSARVYVSQRVNKTSLNRYVVTMHPEKRAVVISCYERPIQPISNDTLSVFAQVRSGKSITQDQYDAVRAEFQSILNDLKSKIRIHGNDDDVI